MIEAYTCDKCYTTIVTTKTANRGITPSGYNCPFCVGMISPAKPTHEWVEEKEEMTEGEKMYAQMGGLFLRKITQ